VTASPQPLRILHLSHPVDGGVARVLLDVVLDQHRRGWSVFVACPAEGELPTALRAAGIPHEPWDAVKVKQMGTPRRVRALRRLVSRVDPDVVHLHSASAGLTGRLAIRGRLPTLFQPHGWTWQSSDGAFSRVAVAWERFAQRYATRVVCVSEAELLAGRRAGLALRDAVVVPNGVDLVAAPIPRAAARQRLSLDDQPTAVCVGRLDEQKGQHVLLEAWPGVVRAVPTARLVLVGDGPARPALEQRAGESGATGSVEFVGARDDARDWYAAATVVVFCSVYGEGMPLVPLEAQAAGRSLVASDLPGVREALGAGAGALFQPGDVSSLTEALVARLRAPQTADEEGTRGRRNVEERYDVRRSLDQLAALTAQVAAQRVSGST
jgi:glycosyltransferase involved in cell wall biosynthesis